MDEAILKAAKAIKNSKCVIALTGAGVSVESGIPDFRSAGGLWSKYDPAIYASIDTFRAQPRRCWDMIFEMLDLTTRAEPNAGHVAMAELESMGYLKAVITQNVDCLHQRGGSRRVIEYHGSAANLECLGCRSRYDINEYNTAAHELPLCKNCGAVLKPSIIFFGEMIPVEALMDSRDLAEQADVVIVAGTSAVVYPAAAIPHESQTARRHGHRGESGEHGLFGKHYRHFHQGPFRKDPAGACAGSQGAMRDGDIRRIQLLSESVKSKISAGEVVEGPFSVVKELVENSLDAGATRVEVHAGMSGLKRISVSDNGHGILRDDAALALRDHATSKTATFTT